MVTAIADTITVAKTVIKSTCMRVVIRELEFYEFKKSAKILEFEEFKKIGSAKILEFEEFKKIGSNLIFAVFSQHHSLSQTMIIILKSQLVKQSIIYHHLICIVTLS